jgi:hypothetical protein
MFNWKSGKKQSSEEPSHSLIIDELKDQIKNELNSSSELIFRTLKKDGKRILFCYLDSVVDKKLVDDSVMKTIQDHRDVDWKIENLVQILPISQLSATNQLSEVTSSLLDGVLYIFIEGEPAGLLANTSKTAERSLEKAETEALVYGPKIAFTESLTTNINILRNNIKDTNLCLDDVEIGKRGKTKGKIIYIKDIADEQTVNTFKQRVCDLNVDQIPDTTVLGQLIEANSWTVFPQIMSTELPDRLTVSLLKGKIAVMMDRSPAALYGPTPFFSFFETTEDVYMRWNMGLFLRLLRLTAIFLSVLLTPAYVAVVTYHYEVIPSPLLVTLGQSRSNVPFPPVFEALLLEFVIELLREAGARLPTKVGQTMGIVGGIVIGQAAVDAGFTSNILIIIIALSALGSFTSPSYIMGTAIRIIRFPIIIMAGIWGGIGIMVSFCFFLIHLLRLETVGGSYFMPVYPFRWRDLGYSSLRFPIQYLSFRPETNRPTDTDNAPIKKSKEKKDVDE